MVRIYFFIDRPETSENRLPGYSVFEAMAGKQNLRVFFEEAFKPACHSEYWVPYSLKSVLLLELDCDLDDIRLDRNHGPSSLQDLVEVATGI